MKQEELFDDLHAKTFETNLNVQVKWEILFPHTDVPDLPRRGTGWCW